jgi:uncharacterized membrane protein
MEYIDKISAFMQSHSPYSAFIAAGIFIIAILLLKKIKKLAILLILISLLAGYLLIRKGVITKPDIKDFKEITKQKIIKKITEDVNKQDKRK